MNKHTESLRAAAVDLLDTLIRNSGDGRAPFRCLTTMFVDSAAMPVLMIGTADG